MGFGAKLFYPRFTNHGDLLHLGTREIQLVLFKAALLYGVRFYHGAQLVAVQAPTRNIGAKTHWSAWARDAALAHSDGGATSSEPPALIRSESSSEAVDAPTRGPPVLAARAPSKLVIPKLCLKGAHPLPSHLSPFTPLPIHTPSPADPQALRGRPAPPFTPLPIHTSSPGDPEAL